MCKSLSSTWIFVVFCLIKFNSTKAQEEPDDLFSATVKLKELLPTESELITTIQSFIFNEESKLKTLRLYLKNFQLQHEIASKNVEKYLGNPLNAFLLIKRLSSDWMQIQEIILSNGFVEYFQFILSQDLKFPTETDLHGSIEGLIRLQDTYKLKASLLAQGRINKVHYPVNLTSNDCLVIALHAYSKQEYNIAHQWFNEAFNRLQTDFTPYVNKQDLLEYLSWNSYNNGNLNEALNYNKQLIKSDPIHPRAFGTKKQFESVNNSSESYESYKRTYQAAMSYKNYSKGFHLSDKYKELCREGSLIDETIKSELKCFYYKPKQNWFVLIAPFKVEEVYNSPQILVFYDVLSDKMIDFIRTAAVPQLTRAKVVHEQVKLTASNERVGKYAWLDENYYKELKILNTRIEDMTGLTTDKSEILQVLNYGIGGHYVPHYDSINVQLQRIATVVIYLNNVKQGGATVFPKLGLSVLPTKGSALFWFNLHSNLQPDTRTYHASCPVLVGYKWIANKWISEKGQTFKRPCDLQQPLEEHTTLP